MSTKIDFSKMERLSPRADSWDKVCARLNAEKAKGKIVSIKSWYSAIPLAASFVLVSLTAVLPSFTSDIEQENSVSTEYVSRSSVPGILQARTLEWVAISFSNA